MDGERESILCMSYIPGLGSKRIAAILRAIGYEKWWTCTYEELLKVSGIGEELAKHICSLRNSIDPVQIEKSLQKYNIQFITQADTKYPTLLRMLPDSPLYLFIKGNIFESDQQAVAIVGTRKPTYYGVKAANYLSEQAAQAGVTVVSGLARGIDRAAHAGALNAGGRTLAVLAHGLDHIYPKEHMQLAEQIVISGALISEYPPGMQARPQNFTARNRIISGLSLSTIVVEAGIRSGALVTAQFALDQGKEVLAVPGSIFDETSTGTNTLIFEGATPVRTFADVFDSIQGRMWISPDKSCEVGGEQKLLNNQQSYSELQYPLRKIIDSIPVTGVSLNDLVNWNLNISLSELHLHILKLEMEGFLVRMGDRVFRSV